MKDKFLSKAVPRGTRTIWRYLGALFLLFTFAIGNVMAQLSPALPATTLTLPTIPSEGWKGTVTPTYYKAEGSNVYVFSPYELYLSVADLTWTTQNSGGNTSATPSASAPFPASSVFTGYKAATLNGTSKGPYAYRVTNCVAAYVYCKSGSNNKRTITLAAFEVDGEGNVAASAAASNTYETNSDGVISIALSASKEYYIKVSQVGSGSAGSSSGNSSYYMLGLEAPAAAHTVTYKAGDGTGTDVVDNDAKTVKAFADCSFTAPSGYEFKEWQDGSSNVVAEGATVSTDMTLTAIYRLIPTKYTVTYSLNGASGDAPTETDKAEGDVFTLASAPSWAGHAFDGWLCSADAAVKAAGASYTMTAANTTFTAQWHEVDCKIYSLTGEIGSAAAEADASNVEISAASLVLKSSNAIIKLTPGEGTFKAGDVLTISGTVGNTSKDFGVKISASNGKGSDLGTASVAGTTNPLIATATLSADADYLYICRTGGTTQTLKTVEVHRACAEGAAAGLSYAEATVNKTEGDAAFTNPLTNTNDLVLAGYKSSDASVATVDFSTGAVTIVGAGDATISANSAVQTKSGTLYAAGTASYALHVAAIPTYTVTYDLNGGTGTTPTEAAKAAGATFTLHNGATDITAPASQEFDGWLCDIDAVKYAASASYTMTAANTTFTAQWRAITDKFVVIYMDGAVEMGRENVIVGQHPTASAIDKTKPLYTFSNWKNASDEPVNLADVSGAKDEEITVYAEWNKVYAQDADLEGLVESEGTSADWQAYLTGKGYSFETEGDISLDSKASGKTYENWPYQGLKMKKVGAYVEGRIAADKLVIIKLGHMAAAANVSLDGVAAGTATGLDAAEPAGKLNYFYVENESVLRYETTNAGACVLKAITIQDPFQVLFDENGGDPVAPQFGHPAVTLPDASNGTKSLLGWFDDATAGNKIGEPGDSYTPTGNITLYAHWEDISTDARLASITFSSAAGTLSPAFDPEVVNYTYTMPYPTAAVPTITGATSVSAKAKTPVIDAQAANWGDVAHIHGVAQSDDTKDYYITMLQAPKDGISIIKVATTGGTNKTVTGLYAGDGDVNLSSSKKMDNGKYIGFTLDGTTLQAGDQINVHTTTASNTEGSHIIFYDNMTDKNELYETGEIGGTGDNIFEINAAMIGATTAYVYRSNADAAHQWNGYVDFIEVLRPMNPVLTAIQFNSTDVAVTGTSVSATLPYGTNLASMTVTPTIVWNGAGTATVTGSWAWGANTFVVTDKDGDATTYTITLTEDELKYTVSFNTHGGSAVASKDIVAGGYLTADDVPADPEKEDYTFQHWSLTEDGAEVDITTVQVNAAVEFHAVWAAETGVIKLLDGEGHVNHTDFITAMTEGTVNFDDADHNCVTFGSTASTIVGATGANKFIIYNAKTNQTKIKFVLYNTNSSAQKIVLQKLAEGESATTDIEIEVPSKERFETPYYAYNSDDNRTMYAFTKNTNIKVLQVKVVDDGTPVKQAGEVGYSLNLNLGRVFAATGEEVNYDGLTMEASSNYKVLNSTELQTQENISFTVASPVTLVLESKGAKYQVSTDAAGSGDEYAAGTNEHDLTAGTWYIVSSTGSNMKFTNIAFTAPKCEKPAIVDMSDVDLCENDPYTALTVSASVSDGGTLHYAWFKEAGATDEPVGTDAASFTPDADGEYYVIVTNQKEDFADNSETSNAVTVQHLAGTVITTAPVSVRKDAGESAILSVVAAGKNLAYEWFTCNADGTGAEPLEPAATEASLNVTVPDGEQYYKVVVTGDCGTVEAIAKVEKWVELQQQDVTETTFWDFSKTGVSENVTIPVTEEEPVKLLANIPGVNNNELFRSDNIVAGDGKLTTTGYIQTQKLSFHATVPGYITVTFSNTGSKSEYRYLVVNGVQTSAGSKNTTAISYSCAVPAGDVELTVTEGNGGKMFNFRSLKFEKMDYYRETRPGYYGTICLEHGGKVYGAALYEVAYFDGADKIFFDEIVDGTMVPGMPYIFLPEGDGKALAVAYSEETPSAVALSKNGLHGSYEKAELDPDDGNYILLNNQYVFVNTTNVFVGANRAYIRLEEIGTTPFAPAPGRRRISMGVSGESQAQGFENLDASEKPMKVMIDGQMYILRGEKVFDATGRLVK